MVADKRPLVIETHIMTNSLKLSDALTKEELKQLRKTSNSAALANFVWTWGLIAAAFAVAIIWTNPLTIIAGIIILGSRQLALSVLMHDCAHYAYFENEALDKFAGSWLAGGPINAPLEAYRDYHLEHHKFAGTLDDPDYILVQHFPVPQESLRRKFVRDLTGQTGVRDTLRKIKSFSLAQNYRWLVFHLALLGTLTLVGAPWAYLMWWAAEIFVYPAIMRLRQISEHGVARDRTSSDPRDNTCTTLAPWWQRVLVAPHNVNYHLEHHFLAAIPSYNLKSVHEVLKSRGFYTDFPCLSAGYGDVLRRAVRREPESDAQAGA
jgi:fatty acid desaturase